MRGPISRTRSSGTRQTPMPFAENPARRWKRIAATRRRRPRSTISRMWPTSASTGMPSFRRGDVGLGDDRHVALRGADDGAVELVVGLLLELAPARPPPRWRAGRCRPPISRSMRILNSLSAGSWRIDSAPVSLEDIERALQAELRVLLDGDREPHVEGVVAQVVVRHARVRVDDLRGPPRVLGVDARGDEHRAEAECARVVDRRDLADDALVDEPLTRASTRSSGTSRARATAAYDAARSGRRPASR